MLIAQITDTHIKPQGHLAYGKVNTEQMLRQCVRHLQQLNTPADVVTITGDLVDFGLMEEYELLADCLSSITQPILLIAGNHDKRQMLRRAFKGDAWAYLHQHEEFVQYAIQIGALRFIGLDTLIPGNGAGLLCKHRLQWLDQKLSEQTISTVVLMHHPPFLTGIAHMDQQGLTGRAGFASVIAKYPHVCRILCGHLHRPIQACVAGVLASTAPSPAHQVALDLHPQAPDCFVMEPPGYQLHLWRDSTMISHQMVVGEFAGPFPFREHGRLIE